MRVSGCALVRTPPCVRVGVPWACVPPEVYGAVGGGVPSGVYVCMCRGARTQVCTGVCAGACPRGRVPARPRASPGAGARGRSPRRGSGCRCRCFTPCRPVPPPRPAPQQDVEAAMRLPLAFAVLLLASARALAEEMGAPDDLSYWSDWSDGDQVKVSPGGRCSARGAAGAGRWVPGAAPGGRGAGGGGGSALSAGRCPPAGGAAAAPGALSAEDGPETPAPAVLRPHGQAGCR